MNNESRNESIMGTKIFCFSATGNSLYIARNIAEKIEHCAVLPITSSVPNEPVGGVGQSLGFVFPVYFNGLPKIVKRFAEALNIHPHTYCFAIANSGGTRANALGMLDNILLSKGVRLSYADEIKMPGSYIIAHHAPDQAQADKIIAEAAVRTQVIAKAVSGHELRLVKQKAKLWSKIINDRFLYKNAHKLDEKFTATNKCTGCGLCADVCPVNNIKIENNQPCWQHNCEQCLACLHWCPCETIEYGKETIGRNRYHNPYIVAADIVHHTPPWT